MIRRKDYINKTADDMLKKQDEANKLLAFSKRASGLTSFLVNKSKEDILLKEATKNIPVLKDKLIEHKAFFERKTVKSDHIRNLNNEISKCEEFIERMGKETDLEDLKFIMDWYYKTSEKYGF